MDTNLNYYMHLWLLKVIFELDGKEIEFYKYEFSQNKVFLLMEDGTLTLNLG